MQQKYAEMIVALENMTGDEFKQKYTEIAALEQAISEAEIKDQLKNKVNTPGVRKAAPVVTPVGAPAPKGVWGGFSNLADAKLDNFIAAVGHGRREVERFFNTAGDVFQESVDADGKLVLPIDKKTLLQLISPATTVHQLVDVITTGTNAITVPMDEDPDWSTALSASDVSEGTALTESKAAFTSSTLTLVKSGNYTRVTREMIEDVPGIASYVLSKLGRKLAWTLNTKACAAFLAAASKVTVPKTTGAAAGSAADYHNINVMYSAMLPEQRQDAIWIANPGYEAALQETYMAGASGGIFPLYVPPGGLADAPYGKLKGRPIYFVENMPAVGTTGDIILVNPQTFWGVLKTQGPRIESSIDAEFKNDVVVYRGFVRSVYKSKFTAPITRPTAVNGLTQAGNVVLLATR
jgi:HK97 family phage major capsid protein